jgi:hypothetical protein
LRYGRVLRLDRILVGVLRLENDCRKRRQAKNEIAVDRFDEPTVSHTRIRRYQGGLFHPMSGFSDSRSVDSMNRPRYEQERTLPIQMQVKAVPVDETFHLTGFVAHYGLDLTDPDISLRIAGRNRTIALGNGGYVDIDEIVLKADLLADPTTEARSSHVGFPSYAGPRPAADYLQTGLFEPAARHPDVLLHKGLGTLVPASAR